MAKTKVLKVVPSAKKAKEAGTFTKRIGSTVYRVGVHFSDTNIETAKDKIARLVRLESQSGKAAGQ